MTRASHGAEPAKGADIPREPTEAMLAAAATAVPLSCWHGREGCRLQWRAMWDAARASPSKAEGAPDRDRDWILAMGHALGLDSGFRVPIVPEVEPFRELFAAIRHASPAEGEVTTGEAHRHPSYTERGDQIAAGATTGEADLLDEINKARWKLSWGNGKSHDVDSVLAACRASIESLARERDAAYEESDLWEETYGDTKRILDEEVKPRLAAAESENASLRAKLDERWISIEHDLPRSQHMVLLHIPSSHAGPVAYGFRDFADGKFKIGTAGVKRWTEPDQPVTHWMPLPEPPARQSAKPQVNRAIQKRRVESMSESSATKHKFTVDSFGRVIATGKDGGTLEDQSVVALLLLEILRLLERET